MDETGDPERCTIACSAPLKWDRPHPLDEWIDVESELSNRGLGLETGRLRKYCPKVRDRGAGYPVLAPGLHSSKVENPRGHSGDTWRKPYSRFAIRAGCLTHRNLVSKVLYGRRSSVKDFTLASIATQRRVFTMNQLTTLKAEVTAHVATIWLDRPDRGNALSAQMSRELLEALASLDSDEAIRAIVVTGSGNTFCAGADMAEAADVFDAAFRADGSYARPVHLLAAAMRTPVIAAMNGSAVGAGLTLPMCWDIRIAAASAKYGFMFTRRGLVPDLVTTWTLPRLIGVARAKDLLLTGRTISGSEAADIGLASMALPADEVLPAAQAMAADIAENTSPLAVDATKALIETGLLTDMHTAADEEARTFRWISKQRDAAEGIKAFLEKRSPAWPSSKGSALPGALDLGRIEP